MCAAGLICTTLALIALSDPTRLWIEAGDRDLNSGRYTDAANGYRKAVAIAGNRPGLHRLLIRLGFACQKAGLPAEAEQAYLQSIAMESSFTAINNLATLYRQRGRLDAAEALLRRAIDLSGIEEWERAVASSNLALVLWDRGETARAEPVLRRTLAIFEKQLGPDSIEAGRASANLAAAYLSTGRPSLARPLAARALRILEHALGPDHPDFAAIREIAKAAARE